MDYLENTTAEDVAKELREEALKEIESLKKGINYMEAELKKHEEGAFPISWCKEMLSMALSVYNNISRANGAILVRGKEIIDKIHKE